MRICDKCKKDNIFLSLEDKSKGMLIELCATCARGLDEWLHPERTASNMGYPDITEHVEKLQREQKSKRGRPKKNA